jgi:hypothetical protein
MTDLPIAPDLQRLIETHPALFRGQAPAISSYVCPGWYGLIDQLCSDIEAVLGPEACARTTVRQIKEKYGELRFYIAFGERHDVHVDAASRRERMHLVMRAVASGEDDLDSREKRVRELIGFATRTSRTVCEQCGDFAEIRDVRGWLKALCDAHVAEAKAKAQLEQPTERPEVSQAFHVPKAHVLVLSDLHLEQGTSYSRPWTHDAFDVVILAGDIQSPGRKAVIWAQRHSVFGGRPVVLVPGNHEYYGATSMRQELEVMRELAKGSNVHVLERGVVTLNGVRFLGCTLWTDFLLPIRHTEDGGVNAEPQTNVYMALSEANRRMTDFKLIQVLEPASRQNRYREFKRPLRAEDTLAMHWVDRDWLRRELAQPFDGPTVVVTHHAPSPLSVDGKYDGDALTPAFASDLPAEYFEVPDLWVHGHTHSKANYGKGPRCHVFSNPRGYRKEDGSFENADFWPGLVIGVPAPVPEAW